MTLPEWGGVLVWHACFVVFGFLAGWAFATRVTRRQRPGNESEVTE